jgi:hypothetical protein
MGKLRASRSRVHSVGNSTLKERQFVMPDDGRVQTSAAWYQIATIHGLMTARPAI